MYVNLTSTRCKTFENKCGFNPEKISFCYFVQIRIIDVYPWCVGLGSFMITITVVGDSNQLCIVLDDGHGDMAHSIFNISMLSKGGPIVQPKDHPKTHFSFSWIKSFNCHQKDLFALTVVTHFIEIDHN